jgi:hypothetical protein
MLEGRGISHLEEVRAGSAKEFMVTGKPFNILRDTGMPEINPVIDCGE